MNKRVVEIDAELSSLGRKQTELLNERRTLLLDQALRLHSCDCVRVNQDLGVYDTGTQERLGRAPLGIGLVSEILSADKDCQVCKGTGVHGGRLIGEDD
jgi:hypothetical protein